MCFILSSSYVLNIYWAWSVQYSVKASLNNLIRRLYTQTSVDKALKVSLVETSTALFCQEILVIVAFILSLKTTYCIGSYCAWTAARPRESGSRSTCQPIYCNDDDIFFFQVAKTNIVYMLAVFFCALLFSADKPGVLLLQSSRWHEGRNCSL